MTRYQSKRLARNILSGFALVCSCISISLAAPASENVFVSVPSIVSNPAAVNVLTGSGTAQQYVEDKLGIHNNRGVRVGGTLIGDVNELLSGGIPNAQRTTFNGLLLLGVSVDTKQFIGWQGGLFDVEFLQFNGQETNAQAGSVQGYNSLPGAKPLQRFEVYKLWYRQEFFAKKLYVRIGKSVPSLNFNNVIKPVPLEEEQLIIPAVSGLMFTPLFVNASMLGVLPGYYNSAYGLTINFVPTRTWYLSYGVYDGNMAQGKQTGLTGPNFNGSYFHIAETGFNWLLGKNRLPGDIAFGVWRQTGLVQSTPILYQHGTSGYYLFGTQRLWYQHPGASNRGISGFYQYGKTTSSVLDMTKYLGAGLTGFALIPRRDNDSMGVGAALSWLNQHTFSRDTELIVQGYYQAQIIKDIYLEPAISYIPTPGASPNLNAAWAGTLRAIILF